MIPYEIGLGHFKDGTNPDLISRRRDVNEAYARDLADTLITGSGGEVNLTTRSNATSEWHDILARTTSNYGFDSWRKNSFDHADFEKRVRSQANLGGGFKLISAPFFGGKGISGELKSLFKLNSGENIANTFSKAYYGEGNRSPSLGYVKAYADTLRSYHGYLTQARGR